MKVKGTFLKSCICGVFFVSQELSVSERLRRQAQQERDELSEEILNVASGK